MKKYLKTRFVVPMKDEVKKLLVRYKIKPDPLKDQFFLADKAILEKILKIAEIKPDEKVIEIGAGLGVITHELAKYSKNILAIEIDKRFKSILDRLPRHVKVIYGNAWEILGGPHRPKIPCDKLISNLPFSLCEPMMHKYTHASFKMILFVVPKKFIYKVLNHHIFGAYYQIGKVLDIPKTAFYPLPDSNAAVLKITRLHDPLKTKNISLFIRCSLYEHEQALVKNTLMEVVIKIYDKLYKQKLTKNEARKIVKEAGITPELLEKPPDNPEVYFESAERLERKIREPFRRRFFRFL